MKFSIWQTTSASFSIDTGDYKELVNNISILWNNAKEKAITAVNTELLDANWQTGKYIVEFEQGGKARAEYGKQLLVNLARDLTRINGKGFNRSNLTYMRKLYLVFPKCGTLSHKLTWSHYYEILKCDDMIEMQFYLKQCIKEGWKVRELKRQMKSCLFQRIALSTDKEGVLNLANDDNPPIGIVLGARKDELLMEYAMQGITNQLFAAKYQLYLPKREELQTQLDLILGNGV